MLKPKLLSTLANYSREQFTSDVIAGVIVGVVALPLAIAFAIASGVSPEKGLYTAIIAGFIISALGGSRVQIGQQNCCGSLDDALAQARLRLERPGMHQEQQGV